MGKIRKKDRLDDLDTIGGCIMLVCVIWATPFIIGIVQALSEVGCD